MLFSKILRVFISVNFREQPIFLYTNGVDQKPSSCQSFSLDVPHAPPVMAKQEIARAIHDVLLTSTSAEEKLLDITLNSELKFEKHIAGICNKASQKIHVLFGIASYASLNKRRLIMRTFLESQFNCCTSMWMFHA